MTKDEYKQLYEQVCEQYDVLTKELDATNRQVEILSDALAESRREVAALKAVQEPVAWMYEDMMGLVGVRVQKEKPIVARPVTPLCLCTPPAAQRQWVEVEQIKWDGDKLIAKLKENT